MQGSLFLCLKNAKHTAMFKSRAAFAPIMLSIILVACGPADGDIGPGGVSVEDADALDEAAAKLDAGTPQQTLQK
jgi:hypothetical protein